MSCVTSVRAKIELFSVTLWSVVNNIGRVTKTWVTGLTDREGLIKDLDYSYSVSQFALHSD